MKGMGVMYRVSNVSRETFDGFRVAKKIAGKRPLDKMWEERKIFADGFRRYVDSRSLLSHRDSSNVIMIRGYIYGGVRRSSLTFVIFALFRYKYSLCSPCNFPETISRSFQI